MMIGVLDDNPAICQLLETLLSFAGYLVYASTDAANFVTKISACVCIVVDYHLSGKWSGTEVIRQIRLAHPHLPAVLISANPIPQAALDGLSDVEVLRKPFATSLLIGAITGARERSVRLVLSPPL